MYGLQIRVQHEGGRGELKVYVLRSKRLGTLHNQDHQSIQKNSELVFRMLVGPYEMHHLSVTSIHMPRRQINKNQRSKRKTVYCIHKIPFKSFDKLE